MTDNLRAMKHFRLIPALFLLLAVSVLTSCDEDGEARMASLQLVSEAEFTRLVDGKAWTCVEAHEIKAGGTLRKAGYWDGLSGGSPAKYSFSGGEITTYMYLDSYPMHCRRTDKFTFGEGSNKVMSGQDEMFTVVSVSADRLCLIKHQSTTAGGKAIYIYAVYRAMTAAEQALLEQDYPYSLNTLDKDFPRLPEQETVTEADFKAKAVGRSWRCSEAHLTALANRYRAAGLQDDGETPWPPDYELASDTIYETPAGKTAVEGVRKARAYVFNANGMYIDMFDGTTLRILSLGADEMHVVEHRRGAAAGAAAARYCVYRRVSP